MEIIVLIVTRRAKAIVLDPKRYARAADLYLVVFRAATVGKAGGGQECIAADLFRAIATERAECRRAEVARTIGFEPAVLLRQQLLAIHARQDSISNAQRLRRAYVAAWREHTGTPLRKALVPNPIDACM